MEHERGAFKVNPAAAFDAVKKWLEIHGFHNEMAPAVCCKCEITVPEF